MCLSKAIFASKKDMKRSFVDGSDTC
jgi:hypothetical protein